MAVWEDQVACRAAGGEVGGEELKPEAYGGYCTDGGR